MEIVDATQKVAEQVRGVISRQMSEALVQARCDLSDPHAVFHCLRAANFGVRSIAVLIDKAVAAASCGSSVQAIAAAVLILALANNCLGETYFD